MRKNLYSKDRTNQYFYILIMGADQFPGEIGVDPTLGNLAFWYLNGLTGRNQFLRLDVSLLGVSQTVPPIFE